MTPVLQVLLFEEQAAAAHLPEPALLTIKSPLQQGMRFVAYYSGDEDSAALCDSVEKAVCVQIAPESFTLEHATKCSTIFYITILKASSDAASVGHMVDALKQPGPSGTPVVTISDAEDHIFEVKEEGKTMLQISQQHVTGKAHDSPTSRSVPTAGLWCLLRLESTPVIRRVMLVTFSTATGELLVFLGLPGCDSACCCLAIQ